MAGLSPGSIVPTLTEVAEKLVALTNSDTKKVAVAAALARKSLSLISDGYENQVSKIWESAHAEASAHLMLVMKNNPHKTKESILARPDVQSALRHPYEEAAQKTEKLIRSAWKAAEADTVKKVKGEFKLFGGVPWKGHETDTALLEALVEDVHRNAKDMRARYREILTAEHYRSSRVDGLGKDGALRARYSLTTAIWGCAASVRDSALSKAGLYKQWVAVLDDSTCSECSSLDGMVIKPYKSFPVQAGKLKIKVYKNRPLVGPPRHPNCRCVLVGVKHLPKKGKRL